MKIKTLKTMETKRPKGRPLGSKDKAKRKPKAKKKLWLTWHKSLTITLHCASDNDWRDLERWLQKRQAKIWERYEI